MNRMGIAILKGLAKCVPVMAIFCLCAGAEAQGTGVLIVKLKRHAEIRHVVQDYGLIVLDLVPDRNVYEVTVVDPDLLNVVQTYLEADNRVVYCEEEASVALPEVFGNPFHLAFDRTPNPLGYKGQQAYMQVDTQVSAGGGASGHTVTVAVLDTGADLQHPSLAGKVLNGFNTLSPNNLPLDVPDGLNNTSVGHGTMISGIIAQVAPDAAIMPIRVLNADGTGTLMNVLQGLHYAVTHGAQVINMSFGTVTDSVALRDGIDEAADEGIVLVASAGNDGSNVPHFPAALPDVLGVGSVDLNNALSSFSDFGVNVSILAPGEDIQSTYWDGTYASWSGTSFAAPFVTAEATAILSLHPHWKGERVSRRIRQTAKSVDALNPGFEGQLGAGLIDVAAALARNDH